MARFLIVDDDADACKPIQFHLERSGHEVTCLRNGKEALAHVIAQSPDAVLLDLMMPEMDGPTFLEVVRSYLRLQSLPVVVITGLSESPMVDRAQHLKVNGVLVKGKATVEDIRHALEQATVQLPG
jgi:CheY-like chemotaxis protein